MICVLLELNETFDIMHNVGDNFLKSKHKQLYHFGLDIFIRINFAVIYSIDILISLVSILSLL
jgi:hypothetical protein